MNVEDVRILKPEIGGMFSWVGKLAARWRANFQTKCLLLTGLGVLFVMLVVILVGAYSITQMGDRASHEMRERAETTAVTVLDNLGEIAAKRLDETVTQAMDEAGVGASFVQRLVDERESLKPLNDFLANFGPTRDEGIYTAPYLETTPPTDPLTLPANKWSLSKTAETVDIAVPAEIAPIEKKAASILILEQGGKKVEVSDWKWTDQHTVCMQSSDTGTAKVLDFDVTKPLILQSYESHSYGNWIQTKEADPRDVLSIYGNMVESPARPDALNRFPGPGGKMFGVNPTADQTIHETRLLKLLLDPIRTSGLKKPQVYFQGGKNAGFFRNSPWVDVVKNTETAYPGGNNKETWSFFWNGLIESWNGRYEAAQAKIAADSKLTFDDIFTGADRIHTVIQPYEDAFNPGHFVMSVYHPIWDHKQKRVYGIFGVDVAFDTLTEIVESQKVGKQGFAFLLRKDAKKVLACNHDGLRILGFEEGFKKANRSGSVTGLELKLSDSITPEVQTLIDRLPPRFSTGSSISRKIRSEGREYLITLRAMTPFSFWDFSPPLKQETWIVGTVASTDEVLEAVTRGQSQFKEATSTLLISQTVVVIICGCILLAILVTFFRAEAAGISTLSRAVSAISSKNYHVQVEVPHRDEIGHLAGGINFMAQQIREHTENLEGLVAARTAELESANRAITELNERLKDENLRMGAELDITRRLQIMALPTDLELQNKHPSLDLAGYMQPAERVGGDLYDALCAEGRLIFAVGDVTDHGLESGVVMLQTMAAGRALFEAGKNISEMREPAHYLTALNRTVCGLTRRLDNDKNLTYSIIDYQRRESGGTLTICGQHEEVLLCRADGNVERLDTQDLGFPLGLIDDIDEMVSTREIEVQPGDIILLYTDGVTEAEDPEGKLYGSDRLVASLKAYAHLPTAGEIRAALIDDLNKFIQGATVQDDISLFVIKHR